MTREAATPFPNHQFDFGDLIFVLPLQQTGTVEGILYHWESKAWSYRVVIWPVNESWWQEKQVSDAISTFDAARH